MASKIVVNLDTSKELYGVFKCKQNDDLTLEAYIFDNGAAKDLTNSSIVVQAKKADNTYIIQNTDINKLDKKFEANLVKDFTRVAGETKIEIVLVESGKQNTTFSFCLEVVESVIKGAVESSNAVPILEELQDKIIEAGQVRDETEELINSGGAATKGDIQEVNTQLAEKAEKTYVDTKIGNMGNTKTFKGSCLFSVLPTSATVDDYWYVTDRTTNYCWNGTAWIDIGNNLNIGKGIVGIKEIDNNVVNDLFETNEINLFDERNAIYNSYMDSSGAVGFSSTACYCIIDVQVGKSYFFYNTDSTGVYGNNITSWICPLDSSGKAINGVDTSYRYRKNYVVPDGVSKLAVTFTTSINCMITVGGEGSIYVPRYVSKLKIINNEIDYIKNEINNNPYIGKTWLSYGDSFVAQNKWQDYISSYLGMKHVNFGHGGYPIARIDNNNFGFALSSDYLLNQLSQKINENNVSLICIMCGANDMTYDGTRTGFNTIDIGDIQYPYNELSIKGGLSKIIRYIRINHPTVEIFICTQPDTKNPANDTTNIDSGYKNALGFGMVEIAKAEKEVGEYFGTHVIDICSKCGVTHYNRSSYVSDGIHPNENLGKIIANIVISYLITYKKYII